jgi:hypothetical protein
MVSNNVLLKNIMDYVSCHACLSVFFLLSVSHFLLQSIWFYIGNFKEISVITILALHIMYILNLLTLNHIQKSLLEYFYRDPCEL